MRPENTKEHLRDQVVALIAKAVAYGDVQRAADLVMALARDTRKPNPFLRLRDRRASE